MQYHPIITFTTSQISALSNTPIYVCALLYFVWSVIWESSQVVGDEFTTAFKQWFSGHITVHHAVVKSNNVLYYKVLPLTLNKLTDNKLIKLCLRFNNIAWWNLELFLTVVSLSFINTLLLIIIHHQYNFEIWVNKYVFGLRQILVLILISEFCFTEFYSL